MAGQKSGSLADDLSHVEFITNDYVEVLPSFNSVNLREDLIRGMHSYGFKRPSPIQQRAIKPMIKGRDVIAQAQSGSGKTAMFLIAMLQSIDTDLKDTQVLCLSPTKELAEQIQKAVLVLGDYLSIQCHACVGGIDLGIDMLKLYFGQQIVSGTPDHVLDMLRHKAIRTHNIKTLVLDQADKMLNKGFKKQIYDVYRFLPLGTQVILICTTLPYETLEVTNKLMTNPFIILVKRNEPALKGIRQHFVGIGKEEWKFEMLCEFYNTLTPTQSVIFCNTKRKVDWLTKKMKEFNFPVNSVYGDMPIKERDAILKEFRRSVPRMLVTTDIWSHGMDVQNALLVLNYDLPKNRELYIHRIGRCGQFGRKGVALSFVETHDDTIVHDKEQLYSVQIEEIPMNGANTHCTSLRSTQCLSF